MTSGFRHRIDVDIYHMGVQLTHIASAITTRADPPQRYRYGAYAWLLRSGLNADYKQLKRL